jgi:hypothetical protein
MNRGKSDGPFTRIVDQCLLHTHLEALMACVFLVVGAVQVVVDDLIAGCIVKRPNESGLGGNVQPMLIVQQMPHFMSVGHSGK